MSGLTSESGAAAVRDESVAGGAAGGGATGTDVGGGVGTGVVAESTAFAADTGTRVAVTLAAEPLAGDGFALSACGAAVSVSAPLAGDFASTDGRATATGTVVALESAVAGSCSVASASRSAAAAAARVWAKPVA